MQAASRTGEPQPEEVAAAEGEPLQAEGESKPEEKSHRDTEGDAAPAQRKRKARAQKEVTGAASPDHPKPKAKAKVAPKKRGVDGNEIGKEVDIDPPPKKRNSAKDFGWVAPDLNSYTAPQLNNRATSHHIQ